MRLSPDQALKKFEKLVKLDWQKLSEADTRSKIIDPIFIGCLNWQEDDIHREEASNTGFVDYTFRIGKKNILVVEAKRKGTLLSFPITVGFKRQYKVNGILAKDKKFKDIMRQTRRYCTEKGVRYGVITNGEQFVVLEAYRIGEDWEEGNCVLFYNLKDASDNFDDFWDLLSKDAVEQGSLVERLSGLAEEFRFTRAVDGIHFKNERQPRNRLYRYMFPIIRHAFSDITSKKQIDLLRKCYVLEPEFRQASESLRSHFSDKPSSLEFKRIVEGEETAGIFLADFYKYAEMLDQMPPEPVILLLLGRIGSGKTTFIFRFFNIVLNDDERKKIKWFYVNFKDAPTPEENIRDYILRTILKEFKAKYAELLKQIQSELKMDDEPFLPNLENIGRLFLVLRYQGYIPSLIIDNVDQHRVGTSTFHERVFLESNSLTKELRTITIMTLREQSFYRSQLDGVFDAYNVETYVIDPPDFRKLLLYRLRYVLENLVLPKEEMQRLFETALDYDPQHRNIELFLKIIENTILGSPRRGVSRFISRTSGGDMRRALQLFSRFLTSGNTKIKEILDTYRREGSYTIAEHQFAKSIVLGSLRYYSEEYSYLLNLFDFNTDFSSSHFLKLKILSYAEDRITNDSPYGRGYVMINKLKEDAHGISISTEAIEDSLLKLAKYGLILLNTRSRSNLNDASHFKITQCGNYYLQVLIKRFYYIDLMLADSPIADIDLTNEIRYMLPSRKLESRFERSRRFLEYLERMECREHELHPEYRLSPLGKYLYAANMISSFNYEKRYITKRIAEKLEF